PQVADVEGNTEPVGDEARVERSLIATADPLGNRLGIGIEQAQVNPDRLPAEGLERQRGGGAIGGPRKCNEDASHGKCGPPVRRRRWITGRRAATPPP